MISRHDQEAGSRTEHQLNQDSKDQLGPRLLALPMIKPTYVSAAAAVGAISLFFVAFGWTEISNQETPFKPAHQIVVVPPEKTAGVT